MSQSKSLRRFKTNPVEVAIFSVVTLIFFHSVYALFYDNKPFYHANLAHAIWTTPQSIQRSPASVSAALMDIQIQCNSLGRIVKTQANGVKMSGPLCGTRTPMSGKKLLEANIINTANHFSATVFSDTVENRFSTDYIPLQEGKNLFQLKFKYFNGEQYSQSLSIVKRDPESTSELTND